MIRSIFLFFSLISASLFAQLPPTLKTTENYNLRELEAWLKKENRPRYVTPPVFSIDGDVGATWDTTHEVLGSQPQVGTGSGRPNDAFNVGTKLQFLYKAGRTWGGARIGFDNGAGIFGGTANAIKLSRAFIGYHFVTHGPFICDLTAGRRSLTQMFDSQLMYRNYGDGACLFLNYQWKNVMEIQVTNGVFINTNSVAFWVMSARLFNIANKGFYINYSYNDWGGNRPSNSLSLIDTKFYISQVLAGWECNPKWLKTEFKAFGAFLVNSGATENILSTFKKENLAGYVGVQFGRARKRNDIAVQGQLQVCQLQAVPDWDFSGIGRGNAARGSLFTSTTLKGVNGNTNYKGFQIQVLYALSTNLTLQATLKRSLSLNNHIGLPSNFTKFSLESSFTF